MSNLSHKGLGFVPWLIKSNLKPTAIMALEITANKKKTGGVLTGLFYYNKYLV